MEDVQWSVVAFSDFSPEQLYDVLKLRIDVFVVEQQCAYPELDEYDRYPDTRHLLGHDNSRQLMAYARLLPPGLRYPEVNLGRLVVRADARNRGLGHVLLGKTLQEISGCWPKVPVKVSAQDYLQKFYEQYGFARISDVYLEDGIPHIEMMKEPK